MRLTSRLLICCTISALSACSSEAPPPVSEPQPKQYVDRGRTLVKGFAACGVCHGEDIDPNSVLAGGRAQTDKYGQVFATNLTSSESGLRGWSTIELMRSLRTNVDRAGNRLSREVHAGYEWMSDNDLLAVISYLRSLPPVDNEVSRRSLGFVERNTTGFMESEVEVTGYVPEIEKTYSVEYGKYVVDHVARCGSCHNTPGGLLDEDKYLAGGGVIRNSHGEKVAPNITSSPEVGIGGWTEDEIAAYLQTGEGPGNRVSDPNFCPVEFYKNAPPEDQFSVAKYLKSVPAQF